MSIRGSDVFSFVLTSGSFHPLKEVAMRNKKKHQQKHSGAVASLPMVVTSLVLPEHGETRRRWAKLAAKIEDLTGTPAYLLCQDSEQYLDLLIEKGELFDHAPIKRVPGAPHQCHRCVAKLWARDVEHTKIVTGYARTDGLWYQHSWGLRDGCICETDLKREHYFGVVLDSFDTGRFFHSECVMPLGGDAAATLELYQKYPAASSFLMQLALSIDKVPPRSY
jgi:hypothetical protein